jgi:hypothetical protein
LASPTSSWCHCVETQPTSNDPRPIRIITVGAEKGLTLPWCLLIPPADLPSIGIKMAFTALDGAHLFSSTPTFSARHGPLRIALIYLNYYLSN